MTNLLEGMSILVTGLGGQGVMLATKALALAAESAFPFVSRTESKGLSQRGGAVFSEVRFARREQSTAIGMGQADLVLSLDSLEALRHLDRLKTGGKILTNRNAIVPVYMLRKKSGEVPEADTKAGLEAMLSMMASGVENLVSLELSALANRLDYPKGLNVALLGAASPLLPIDPNNLLNITLQLVPLPVRTRATSAFWSGREEALKQLKVSEVQVPGLAVA